MSVKRKTSNQEKTASNFISRMRMVLAFAFWIVLIALCLIYRKELTIERIVNYSPENVFLTACIMLGLFALKSVSFVIYGGILYAASGVLFSLPVAIVVNLFGTAIMTTIPFFIGKKTGIKALEHLSQKHAKLELLRNASRQNEWFISFFMRMVRILPSDLVGMYLGASNIRYSRYICGTMLGMAPSVITFSIMGMSIDDVSSPAFIISAVCEVALMIVSLIVYRIWNRKKKKDYAKDGN